MTERVYIGGKPRYLPPDGDCMFLGRLGEYDLYIRPASDAHPEPEVFACSGIEPENTVKGMSKSYGIDPALTAARRVAEFKGMPTVDPLKALFYVFHDDDIVLLRKSLRKTAHYEVLAAYDRGEAETVDARLSALMDNPVLLKYFPHDPVERLRSVDLVLVTMARFLAEDFPPSTFFNATNDKFRELGAEPRGQ